MIAVRNLVARSVCLVAVALLTTSPSLPRVVADAPPSLEPVIEDQLEMMSTGVDQELAFTDASAQARNAAIPVAAGQMRAMSAFTTNVVNSAAYPTALRCLTQAIYYEAANEPLRGKQAVAQVVLNRVRHSAYPNSICGVVYQGVNRPVCQFSFTCDGALTRKPLRRQWQESSEVAQAALSGAPIDVVGTATHYHADYVVPYWAYTLTKVEVVGTHIFYRFPGRPGEANAFKARWSGSEAIPRIDPRRFANSDNSDELLEPPVEETWVTGLTVTPDKTDRHAETDVGGRLDTTKTWRLTIPDPTESNQSYSQVVDTQSAPSETSAPVED